LDGTRFTDVRWFGGIDSTNRYVLAEAVRGAREGLVAVADEQTAGRGRLDRTWIALPGASLLVSVLLRPALAVDRLGMLTLAAGVAAIEAVESLTGASAALKWPNDVVVDDKKLAGILAEKIDDAIVIGMGLNVYWTSFPDDLANTATACNLLSDREVRREDLLAVWLRALDGRLDRLDLVVEEARRRSATLGRRVRVDRSGAAVEGDAVSLTEAGHLVVRADDGAEHVVTVGDVVHLRNR
jgi:BirA family biotin operon repressor/biotin-[acetyl-CoA-carboxylase] ligase